MSTQSQAKKEQDYVPKAIPQTCGVCRNCVALMGDVLRYKDTFRYKDTSNYTSGGTHLVREQVSQKCGIGGFVVKKMGTCAMWLPPVPDNAVVSGPTTKATNDE